MADLPRGKVQTVCGPIEPEQVGVTLAHEHLFHEATSEEFLPRKCDPRYEHLNTLPFDAKYKWWIDYHPYSFVDNLRCRRGDIEKEIVDEVAFFKSNGGSTICELTTFGHDLRALRDTSNITNVNIVAGAGYYVASAFRNKPHIKSMNYEEMYNSIKKDLLEGVDGVKCGLIGEVASSLQLQPFEKQVIQVAGELQGELKVPVNIHPARYTQSPFELVRLYQEAGGRVDKLAMSHLDRTLFEDPDLLEFAALGAYNEFDLFGIEWSYYELIDHIDYVSDAIRIKRLKLLVDEGFGDKILISQDIHTKHRMMKFGGHGYSHVLLNVAPKMKMRGYTQQNVDDILIHNPRNFLTL